MMMKKAFCLLLAALLLFALCACSLDYSTTETEGAFTYACGEKKAFVSVYSWDGTEAGRTVDIPEAYGKRKIVAVGGYFGRGLPMPFRVDISGWLDLQPGHYPESTPEGSGEIVPDETVYLDFTILTGPNVEETHLTGEERSYRESEGCVTEYVVRTNLGEKQH